MKNILHLYNFLICFSHPVVLLIFKEIKSGKKGSEKKPKTE